MSQSLLEMRESFTVWVSQKVSALEESRCDIKVLRWRWSRCRWRSWIQTRRADPSEIIVITDWLLLASDFHFFIFLISVLSVNLFEMHRYLAKLLQCLSREHHLFAISKFTIEELLHYIHIIDDERMKTLQVSCWIQLSQKISFDRCLVDYLTTFCILICFVTTWKRKPDLINFDTKWKSLWTHHVQTPFINAHGWIVSNRRLLFSQILLNKSTHSFSSTQFAVWM